MSLLRVLCGAAVTLITGTADAESESIATTGWNWQSAVDLNNPPEHIIVVLVNPDGTIQVSLCEHGCIRTRPVYRYTNRETGQITLRFHDRPGDLIVPE